MESASLVSARTWQRTQWDRWVNQWSRWWTVMCYMCCGKLPELSGRQKWCAGWQQYVATTPETASETSTLPVSTLSLKNVTLFSWALLDHLVYFSFHSFLLYTCFHTFISWSCTISCHLVLLISNRQGSSLYSSLPSPLVPLSVHVSPCLQPSSYKNLAGCFASLNKHSRWGSLLSCGSLLFSWLTQLY